MLIKNAYKNWLIKGEKVLLKSIYLKKYSQLNVTRILFDNPLSTVHLMKINNGKIFPLTYILKTNASK